jgi:hypothetical protein
VPHAEPTPAECRATAAAAEALAETIDYIVDRLRANNPNETETGAYVLANGATQVRQAAHDLWETASTLARARTARAAESCGIPWGVCPDHGNTLTTSGGMTQCRSHRCGRTWTYDRLGAPCTEPVTHQVTARDGRTFRACAGHALDAEQRLDGATLTRLGA